MTWAQPVAYCHIVQILRILLTYWHVCSKLTTQLLLHDVLYTLAVGYTLISMGRLDSEGYQASSGEGRLILTNPDSECIGLILKSD